MQDGLTLEQKRSYENGIRIFARWIARAYIKDMVKNEAETKMEKETEDDCASKKARNQNLNQGD